MIDCSFTHIAGCKKVFVAAELVVQIIPFRVSPIDAHEPRSRAVALATFGCIDTGRHAHDPCLFPWRIIVVHAPLPSYTMCLTTQTAVPSPTTIMVVRNMYVQTYRRLNIGATAIRR
jgi:hypothetical protein